MNRQSKYYTIFVVEDSDVYRSIIMQALEAEKETDESSSIRFNVYGFASGEECMEQVHLKPDILIMDYFLNGNGYLNNMNGLELLKKIKNIIPKLNVIVLSCQDNIQVAKEFIREGIKEYIKKEGLSQHKVKEVIGGFMRNWEKRNQRKRRLKEAAIILAIAIMISAIIFTLA